MKTLKDFKNESIATGIFKNLYGGAKAYKTNGGPYGDVFYDNDENGSISPGDTICYNTRPVHITEAER